MHRNPRPSLVSDQVTPGIEVLVPPQKAFCSNPNSSSCRTSSSTNAPQQLRWQRGEFQDPAEVLPGESCSRVPRLWRCGRAGGVTDDASMPLNMSASYARPTRPLVASVSHKLPPAVTRRRVPFSAFQDPHARQRLAGLSSCPVSLCGESCAVSPSFFLPSCSPRRQPPPQPSHILPVHSCCNDSSSSSASHASSTFPPGVRGRFFTPCRAHTEISVNPRRTGRFFAPYQRAEVGPSHYDADAFTDSDWQTVSRRHAIRSSRLGNIRGSPFGSIGTPFHAPIGSKISPIALVLALMSSTLPQAPLQMTTLAPCPHPCSRLTGESQLVQASPVPA